MSGRADKWTELEQIANAMRWATAEDHAKLRGELANKLRAAVGLAPREQTCVVQPRDLPENRPQPLPRRRLVLTGPTYLERTAGDDD